VDLAIDQRGARSRWSLDCGWAGWGLQPVHDVGALRSLVRQRRSGRIVVQNGRLDAIYGRWLAYQGNLVQVLWDRHLRMMTEDRCELYYHSPRSSSGTLTLDYVRSGPRTSLSSFYGATLVLDEIARLKQAMIMVCHVTNDRISDRLLKRWGWQSHCPDWSGRHFIKRLYGEYPVIPALWRKRLNLG
jgi:hypothetical protein